MSAGAFIFRHGAVIGKREDFRGIPAAVRAVDAHRIVILTLSFLGALGTEAVQDVKNLSTLLQRMNHILGIFSGTVHLGLVTVIHMDAETFHCLLELIFKMLCVVGAAVIIGIGHVHIRIADILIPGLLSLRSGNLGHVYRDFAEPVEFIPGKKKPRFLSLAS